MASDNGAGSCPHLSRDSAGCKSIPSGDINGVFVRDAPWHSLDIVSDCAGSNPESGSPKDYLSYSIIL